MTVRKRAPCCAKTRPRSASAAHRASSADATRLGPVYPVEPFGLAFLDPPYGRGLAQQALVSAREGDWFLPGALVVVEEAKAAAFAAPEGFIELERRSYDDSEFVLLRFNPR